MTTRVTLLSDNDLGPVAESVTVVTAAVSLKVLTVYMPVLIFSITIKWCLANYVDL